MAKCIVIEHPDGTVSIRGGLGPDMLARFNGDVDAALQWILDNKVPEQNPDGVASIVDWTFPPDRTFRRAWRRGVGAVVEDPDECRAVHADRVQAAKRERLRELRDREDDGENVAAERAALRAVNPQAEAASKTPAELRAHWPAAVERRGAPR